MPQGQGRRLVEKEVNRIKSLLAKTEMTFIEIAERVARSRSVVRSITSKFKIRRYLGRNNWIVENENLQGKEPKDSSKSPLLLDPVPEVAHATSVRVNSCG